MHPKNRYHGPHDFADLARVVPELKACFLPTPSGRDTLDFSRPDTVRLLNKALLLRDFGLKYWDLPEGALCPGVPGRLDYIHVLADLLGPGEKFHGLDIGTGASLIYPILGAKTYGWSFTATDVDATALKVATALLKFNRGLNKFVELRQQPDPTHIFTGIIRPGERYDFTLCNPPFYTDAAAAEAASRKKWEKLGRDATTGYNFGGRPNELWTPGGEPAFLRRMILDSISFAPQVGWFTTLVSRKGYLRAARQLLVRERAREHRVIGIGQGGKIRRVLAWQF